MSCWMSLRMALSAKKYFFTWKLSLVNASISLWSFICTLHHCKRLWIIALVIMFVVLQYWDINDFLILESDEHQFCSAVAHFNEWEVRRGRGKSWLRRFPAQLAPRIACWPLLSSLQQHGGANTSCNSSCRNNTHATDTRSTPIPPSPNPRVFLYV